MTICFVLNVCMWLLMHSLVARARTLRLFCLFELCLDLQAHAHVQWLRFQHISAYSLRKTSGNTKDNCSVYHQVSCASNYPLHACRFIHHLSPQWNNKMTFAKACVATLAVAACAAGGVDARRGVAGLSLEHNGRALTQSRSLSAVSYLASWLKYYTGAPQPVLHSWVPFDRNIRDLLGSFAGCHIEQTRRDCRIMAATLFPSPERECSLCSTLRFAVT